MTKLIGFGDPHGEWQPLLRACEQHRPDGVLIVGDCDLVRPLREELAPLWNAGIAVHYVPGNHDSDSEQWWDNLVADHETGNLHARVVDIGGLRVAGLGGVWRGQVWYPHHAEPEQRTPRFRTREQHVATLRKGERWRDWVPRRHRSSIYPEDIESLLTQDPADILVCHEAPSCYRHERPGHVVEGVAEIDELAEALGARLVVHGHHHHSYSAELASGIRVRGLARAEPWVIEM